MEARASLDLSCDDADGVNDCFLTLSKGSKRFMKRWIPTFPFDQEIDRKTSSRQLMWLLLKPTSDVLKTMDMFIRPYADPKSSSR